MDQILASIESALEKLVHSFGMEQAVSEVWLWVSLGSLFLLLFYLLVWFLLRSRKPGRRTSDGSPALQTGEAEEGSSSAAKCIPSPSGPAFREAGGLAERPFPPPEEDGAAESLLDRLRGRLAKTHNQLIGRLDQIFLRNGSRERDWLEDLEEILVTADLGVKTSYDLLGEIKKELDVKPMGSLELKGALRQKIGSMLVIQAPDFVPTSAKPFVIMVVGVNGVGKTTSIGKLASHLQGRDRRVMLVAADTFRAAAIEQLQIWSDRAGTDFVKQKPDSDPSAVVYDAIQAAKARDTDIVIVDTAGRLHTKANLMEELKKVKRIMSRELEGAPHEVLLVVDATTGQNAISQARTFHQALGVTGIILTKLDGTAKGGVIVGIANELQLPVRFIGIGERVEDLREFDADLFLEAIFGEPEKGWVH